MKSQTMIFWGAGATADLGIKTTVQQSSFIRKIVAEEASRTLRQRVDDAINVEGAEQWRKALCDLITILGDSNDAYYDVHLIDSDQMEAMRRNWRLDNRGTDEELRHRILELRLIYDWPALKSVVRICPAFQTAEFKLNDLFNLLDLHIPANLGFHAPPGGKADRKAARPNDQFLDARRLIGAKNALLLLLTAVFHIDYQICLSTKRDRLEKYRDFAIQIAQRAQRGAVRVAQRGKPLDQSEFYGGDVDFVSLNYDPIGLWIQWIANRELNSRRAVPHVGHPGVPLHLYHDLGHLIPSRGIGKARAGRPWYPLNEAAAQRLNEPRYRSGYRVRLTKFLFPHGCLCWRECADCGKLSAFHGDEWDLFSNGLFPPPPLRAFDQTPIPDWVNDDERDDRQKGKVDARACLHCGTLTYAHHTQVVMQSSFKSAPPSFIEEIQRDLRAAAMRADHFILMGYSLPADDVAYRAFFSSRRRRKKRPGNQPVRCTIIGKNDSGPRWYGPDALKDREFLNSNVIKAARDIFGEENIRFYGGGVPKVFLDVDGRATDEKLEELLNWESTKRA
jgi:hypothetical protein